MLYQCSHNHSKFRADIVNRSVDDSELLDEYDFSQTVRRQSLSDGNLSNPTVRFLNGKEPGEVTIKTVEVSAIVTPEGQLAIQLPPDITPGEHRTVLLIEEPIPCSVDP